MSYKKIDEYYVTNQLLSKDKFSQVFLAYSQQYSKLAVKIIPRINIIEKSKNMFENEINSLKRCKSRNIINCIDIKKSKKNFYLFLEYCEGGSLSEYISKNRKLPQNEAMNIFGTIIKSMNYLRKLRIIHRDLKPANIMLKQGQIKIVNFGLARKYYKGQMMQTFTEKPFNVAPEILKGCSYNQKVDIYSAGTILYEMIYGNCPFIGNDLHQLISKIQNQSLNQQNDQQNKSQVSKDVKQLLKLMLQPNLQNRIDLIQVTQRYNEYKNQQIMQKIFDYRSKSLCSLNYLGVFCGLSFPFNFSQKTSQKSIEFMDLRIYNKLYKKLIVPQETKSLIINI